MIFAVYLGTLIPMLFLTFVIKGEYRRLLLFFLWGLTSSIMVYFLDFFLTPLYQIKESTILTQWGPALEELVKGLPLIFILFGRKKTVQYSVPRLAMAVGIGFSILENYMYLSYRISGDIRQDIFFIVTRSMTACVLHGCMTALIGFAVQTMRDYNFRSPSFLAGMYLLSCTIHAVYNLVGYSSAYNFLGIFIPFFLFLTEHYVFNFFGRKNISAKQKEGA